ALARPVDDAHAAAAQFLQNLVTGRRARETTAVRQRGQDLCCEFRLRLLLNWRRVGIDCRRRRAPRARIESSAQGTDERIGQGVASLSGLLAGRAACTM